MKNFQRNKKYQNPFQNVKSENEYLKKVTSFLIDVVSTYDDYPVPVVIIELEIPPTSNGLFFYSMNGIEELTKRFFDFKDSSLEREMNSSRVFRYQQFWNDELYRVPVLRISFVIIGGELCQFSHHKLELQTHYDLLENVGLSGIYYQFTSNNYFSLINSITSPFPEITPKNLSSFNDLKSNYVNFEEILHIASIPIVELSHKDLFSNQ